MDLSVSSTPEPVVEAFQWSFKEVPIPAPLEWNKNDVKHVRHIHQRLLQPIVTESVDSDFAALIKSLGKKNMRSLKFVCDDLQLAITSPVRKATLVHALVSWRHLYPLTGAPHPTPRVVTPQVIARIRDVLRQMTKPSWLNALPSDFAEYFGTATGGSSKASEWCMFFTVYLPVALVSLWGESGSHLEESNMVHLQKVLDNTMALVSAVSVASSHYMTSSQAGAYLDCIKTYVSGLSELYPHLEPRTNEHVAFRIHDFLWLYGPIWSWWCFPFERLVGILQGLNSNHKIGMFLQLLPHAAL